MTEVWPRYVPPRKPFVIRYGGMAYRGEGPARYGDLETRGKRAKAKRRSWYAPPLVVVPAA